MVKHQSAPGIDLELIRGARRAFSLSGKRIIFLFFEFSWAHWRWELEMSETRGPAPACDGLSGESPGEEKTEGRKQNGTHEEQTGHENEEISKEDKSEVVRNGGNEVESNHSTKGAVINKEEIDSIVADIIKNNLNASKENQENLREEKADYEYNSAHGESSDKGDEDRDKSEQAVEVMNGRGEVSNDQNEDTAEQEEKDESICADVPEDSIRNNENEDNTVDKEDYSCDHCGFETNVRTNLVVHMRDEHEHKRKNSLLDVKGKKLLKTWHQHRPSSSASQTGRRVSDQTRLKIEYICDICNKFSSRNLIQVLSHRAEHLRPPLVKKSTTFNNNNKNTVLKTAVLTTRRPQYDCSMCDFSHQNLIQVFSHMASCHPKRYPGIYTCDNCDFKTSHLLTLISHRSAVHAAAESEPEKRRSDDRPLLDCHMCKFKTAERDKLERHVEKHAGETLHKCDKCNYKTLRPERFHQHGLSKHNSHKVDT